MQYALYLPLRQFKPTAVSSLNLECTRVCPSGLAHDPELEVPTVRELEDLLINECMATGLVRGKLDQRRRCFEVHHAIGRDLRPGQLKSLISTIADWCVAWRRVALRCVIKKKKTPPHFWFFAPWVLGEGGERRERG